MSKLNEAKSFTFELPGSATVECSFECADEVSANKVLEYVKAYISQHQEKDWPNFDIEATLRQEKYIDDDSSYFVISLAFDGTGEYEYYPGSAASFNDPGDPDDWEIPFEEDSFEDYFEDIMKKSPFKYSFEFETVDCKVPTDDQIYDAARDAMDEYYGPEYDDFYESKNMVKAVLLGKSLKEAIMERAGDWDIESDEIYSKAERDQMEYELERNEFDIWKKKAAAAIEKLSQDYSDFVKLVFDSPYSGGFTTVVKGCPLKMDPAKSNVPMQTWLGYLAMWLQKKDPYKED